MLGVYVFKDAHGSKNTAFTQKYNSQEQKVNRGI